MVARVTSHPVVIDDIGHFVLRSGRLLLVSGADAAYVLKRTALLVAKLGGAAELFISGERLLLTVDEGNSYRTRIGRQIAAMGVNTGLFDAVDKVIEDASSGLIDLKEATSRLERLEALPQLHPTWVVIPAVAAATAALCRLFGAAWWVVLAAFAGGVVSIALRRFFATHLVNPIAASFLTAFASAGIAGLLLKAIPQSDPALAFAAAGMILVPGVPLINGISDVANGHPGVGLCRLATGSISVVVIGFAVYLAAQVAGSSLPVALVTSAIPVWQDAVFSAIAALGFSFLFNSPTRAIFVCIICGTISHSLRTELNMLGLDLATSTFLCSMLVGFLAHIAGSRLSLPWPTFAFPGVVAMIPGSYVFRAGVGGLEIMASGATTSPAVLMETASLSITAMILTAALGAGLLIGSNVGRTTQVT
jgi:uncharacterized membrane protein YjjP (DUF1212 family)